MVDELTMRQLRLQDARGLAPLLAGYVQDRQRGAPRRPDQHYAEQLLQDRVAELHGAFDGDELVAFLLFYDLPDPLTGLRTAQVDHVYVDHAHRQKGVGKALLERLVGQAKARGWTRLTLNAPRGAETGRKLFGQVGRPSEDHGFVLRFDQ